MNTVKEIKPIRFTKSGKPDGRCRNNITPEKRAEIGRAGGEALVLKRGSKHMQKIGRVGGRTVSQHREHMAQIGKLGGRLKRALSNLF